MAWDRDVVENAEGTDLLPERTPGGTGVDPTIPAKLAGAALSGHTPPDGRGSGRHDVKHVWTKISGQIRLMYA